MSKAFIRKHKESKPVVAICYDFDKTLTPDDMQSQGFIQSVGKDISSFWKESNKLADDNEMDQNLAYMYSMIRESDGYVIPNKETFKKFGSGLKLFDGVESWFRRLKEYGDSKGVKVEHYIISSGLKEMIEGTKVANEFEKIYASSFYYDERGVAKWPAQVINYTGKTQFLFRIEKGTLDVNDAKVNDYFEPSDIRVPFRNMIYIGDSDTDIPCMKLVNSNLGHSIGVYNPKTEDKNKVYKMMHDNRIKYFAPADYTLGSDLDILVKAIIDRTAYNEKLETIHYINKKDFIEYDKSTTDELKKRHDLILSLENSTSFANTHSIISQLNEYNDWTTEEIIKLEEIKDNNSQVKLIFEDSDVSSFYNSL